MFVDIAKIKIRAGDGGNGAVAVGAGSSLTAGANTGDYKKITETAKQFVANIKAARAELAK